MGSCGRGLISGGDGGWAWAGTWGHPLTSFSFCLRFQLPLFLNIFSSQSWQSSQQHLWVTGAVVRPCAHRVFHSFAYCLCRDVVLFTVVTSVACTSSGTQEVLNKCSLNCLPHTGWVSLAHSMTSLSISLLTCRTWEVGRGNNGTSVTETLRGGRTVENGEFVLWCLSTCARVSGTPVSRLTELKSIHIFFTTTI